MARRKRRLEIKAGSALGASVKILLYYSRTLRSGQSRRARLACLALLLVLSAPVASQTPEKSGDEPTLTGNFIVRREILSSDALPSLPLRFFFHPSARHQDRVIAVTKEGLRLLGEWFGSYPAAQLTIVDTSWPGEAVSPAHATSVVISSRWLTPASDAGLERAVIGALARSYFVTNRATLAGNRVFGEALSHYAGARAINHLLNGAHVLTVRFFGGFVPYPTRSVSLSRPTRDPRPLVRSHPELNDRVSTDAAIVGAEALHTLERIIGWPAMQQALREVVPQLQGQGGTNEDFIGVVNRQRGSEIAWWPSATGKATFDYGVASLITEPDGDNRFTTQVQLRRFGDALPASALSLDVVTVFADGTTLDEHWDGATQEMTFSYISTAPALTAAVDPNGVFLLDANRTNNIRTTQSAMSGAAWRLTVNWMAWLQQLTLTYLALV